MFAGTDSSPRLRVIVCGVAKTPAVSHCTVPPEHTVAIASRKEQSASQVPSLVSAIFVTIAGLPQFTTFCVSVPLTSVSKFPLPLYFAVIGWLLPPTYVPPAIVHWAVHGPA